MKHRLAVALVALAFLVLFLALLRDAPPVAAVPERLRHPELELTEPGDEALESLRRQIEQAARKVSPKSPQDAGPRPDTGMRWFDAGAEWHNDPIVKRAAVGESIPSDGSWDPLRPDASHASESERDLEK